ncbi:MAG: hypothetical protein V9F05_04695 [Chitinophagaceae bacterium]
MRVFLFVIVAAGMFFSSSQQVKGQAATFDVEFIGFSAEAETAFNYATDIWSNFLISDVPIKIVAHLADIAPRASWASLFRMGKLILMRRRIRIIGMHRVWPTQ